MLVILFVFSFSSAWAGDTSKPRGVVDLKYIKTTGSMDAEYSYRDKHPLNVPIPVVVKFSTTLPRASVLKVSAKLPERGLKWINGHPEKKIRRPVSGKKYKFGFAVMPLERGLFELNLELSVKIAGQESVKIIQVPICAGATLVSTESDDFKTSRRCVSG